MHGCMKWAFALLYALQGIATNSKAIASYTQTVTQLDKASIFVMIKHHYSLTNAFQPVLYRVNKAYCKVDFKVKFFKSRMIFH